ncbi:MAG: hypothetical protein AAGI71_08155 [Bacteroidota bacterium]
MPRSLVLLLAFSLGGCSIFGPEDPEPTLLLLETDQSSYSLAEHDEIRIVATNRSESVLYFNTCMSARLDPLSGPGPSSILLPTCLCLCVTELRPGERWTYTISTQWFEANADTLQPGRRHTYRAQLAFYRDEALQHLLPDAELFSNRFDVTQ